MSFPIPIPVPDIHHLHASDPAPRPPHGLCDCVVRIGLWSLRFVIRLRCRLLFGVPTSRGARTRVPQTSGRHYHNKAKESQSCGAEKPDYVQRLFSMPDILTERGRKLVSFCALRIVPGKLSSRAPLLSKYLHVGEGDLLQGHKPLRAIMSTARGQRDSSAMHTTARRNHLTTAHMGLAQRRV